MDAICATVKVPSVPSSTKGSDFVAFRLAGRDGFSGAILPAAKSGRTHRRSLFCMTDLRVREIKRSTVTAREISKNEPRAKRGIQTEREILQAAKESCDGNRKFSSFPRYLFPVGNRASTRLISSVAVSIASRKAISLAGDGRPSNAGSLRHSSIPATR